MSERIVYLDESFSPCEKDSATYARVIETNEFGVAMKFALVILDKPEPKPENFASRFVIETHGDLPGHDFRGNQYTTRDGYGKEDKERIPPGDPRRHANLSAFLIDSEVPGFVYHGFPRRMGGADDGPDFGKWNVFDRLAPRDYPKDDRMDSAGSWFGDKDVANMYGSSGAVKMVALRITNSAKFNSWEDMMRDWDMATRGHVYDRAKGDEGARGVWPNGAELWRKSLIARGYDGVRVSQKGGIDTKTNGTQTFYLALHPEQIKSVTGNRGTFDPTDPNETHAERHGDFVGHPFRGNQWTKGEGGGGESPSKDEKPGWGDAKIETSSRMTIKEAVSGVPHPEERDIPALRASAEEKLKALGKGALDARAMANAAVKNLHDIQPFPKGPMDDITVDEWGAVLEGDQTLLELAVHETAKLWAKQGTKYDTSDMVTLQSHGDSNGTTPGKVTVSVGDEVVAEFPFDSGANYDAALRQAMEKQTELRREVPQFDADDVVKAAAALAFGFDAGSGGAGEAARYFDKREQWRVRLAAATLQREYLDTQKELTEKGLPDYESTDVEDIDVDELPDDPYDEMYHADAALEDFMQTAIYSKLEGDAVAEEVDAKLNSSKLSHRDIGVSLTAKDSMAMDGWVPKYGGGQFTDFANDPTSFVPSQYQIDRGVEEGDDSVVTYDLSTDFEPVEWHVNPREFPHLIEMVGAAEELSAGAEAGGRTLFDDDPRARRLALGEDRLKRFEQEAREEIEGWAKAEGFDLSDFDQGLVERAVTGNAFIEALKDQVHGGNSSQSYNVRVSAEGGKVTPDFYIEKAKTIDGRPIKLEGDVRRAILVEALMKAGRSDEVKAYQKLVGPSKLDPATLLRFSPGGVKDAIWEEVTQQGVDVDYDEEFQTWFSKVKTDYLKDKKSVTISDDLVWSHGHLGKTLYRGVKVSPTSISPAAMESWSLRENAAAMFGHNIMERTLKKEEVLVVRGMKHWKQVNTGHWSKSEHEAIMLPAPPNWKRKKAAA